MPSLPRDAVKIKARSVIASAIARGEIVRPDTCELCGSKPPRAKDGRSNIEAHHEDHTKPFDVQWICTGCHGKLTERRCGENNGSSKLNPSAVRIIRAFYRAGIETRIVARWFGVTSRLISIIGRHEAWVHVDPDCRIPPRRRKL